MNTKRSKRWNGKVETLDKEFLRDVIVQMTSYGDRVQFSLIGTEARPAYQVVNSADKAIAFDNKSHLLRPVDDEFTGKNATPFLTLDRIKALSTASIQTIAVERTRRTGTSRQPVVAKITAEDQINNDKYAYFKSNRSTLPEGIQEYTQEISKLMRDGMSAEEAFTTIVKQHY